MAEEGRSIFNKTATEKLRNPDDLERYIRVTNPSVWVALAACVALLAGLLTWGVFGTVATSVQATGAVVNGQAVCYLSTDDISKVSEGDQANFGGVSLKVRQDATTPLSREEAHAELGNDYLASTLLSEDWGYKVIFDGDVSSLSQEVPLPVNITVEQVSPISLILKNWA